MACGLRRAMPTTAKEVVNHLTDIGFEFRQDPDPPFGPSDTRLSLGTFHYVAPDDERALLVVVRLDEEGRFLSVFAPLALRCEGPFAPALLRACLMVQWTTKMVQFEYDDEDGEIRPVIEFPIEDGTLTREQLERCVRGLAQVVDVYYPSLRRALETGLVEIAAASIPFDDDDHNDLLERVRRASPDTQRQILALLRDQSVAPTEL